MKQTSAQILIICLFALSIVITGCQKDDLYLERSKPELKIEFNDPRITVPAIQFSSDTVYVITNSIELKRGQQLEIESGTLIKVRNKVSITILPGAKIFARGEADAPIIFTSDAPPGTQGAIASDGNGTNFWYGIRVYGDYTSQPNFSTGVLKYVRIEFAGGDESFQGLPNLLLQDVSDETEINHIQVSYSFSTPSFTFSGGNCNASNLVSYACTGNDFLFENGYIGKLQYLIAYRHPFFPVSSPGSNLAGLQITGSGTKPIISNITVIGPENKPSTSFSYSQRVQSASVLVDNNAQFRIRNSAFMNFPKAALYMNNRNAAIALNTGESESTYSFFHSFDTTRTFTLPSNIYPPFTSADFKLFMLNPAMFNSLFSSSDVFLLTDPFNYDLNLNPLPLEGSPLLSGANFSGPDFSDPFFEKVNYRGALDTKGWFENWINFTPLQTKYNN